MVSEVIIAFGALVGGLVAYLTGFALLQAMRRRPPPDSEVDGAASAHDPPDPDRDSKDPPAARPLLEATPH